MIDLEMVCDYGENIGKNEWLVEIQMMKMVDARETFRCGPSMTFWLGGNLGIGHEIVPARYRPGRVSTDILLIYV